MDRGATPRTNASSGRMIRSTSRAVRYSGARLGMSRTSQLNGRAALSAFLFAQDADLSVAPA
eukprot:7381133-Pyramimonas_sp.AAC.1